MNRKSKIQNLKWLGLSVIALVQKTAKQIGVTIPQSMLYRADRVIK